MGPGVQGGQGNMGPGVQGAKATWGQGYRGPRQHGATHGARRTLYITQFVRNGLHVHLTTQPFSYGMQPWGHAE